MKILVKGKCQPVEHFQSLLFHKAPCHYPVNIRLPVKDLYDATETPEKIAQGSPEYTRKNKCTSTELQVWAKTQT